MAEVLDKLITADEAVTKTGLTRSTLDRRLATAGVPVWRDPRDLRKKLINAADLDRLMQPVEVRTRQGAERLAG